MKARDLEKRTKSQLQKLLSEKQAELGNLRFTLTSGKLKNIRAIRAIKKDIARILTMLRKTRNQ